MIANNFDSDCYGNAGTDDDSSFATSDDIKVLEVAAVSLDGPVPGSRGRVSLEEKLGAFYGWVYCKYLNSYSWIMLYWPALGRYGNPPQTSTVRPHGIWSGFMSQARGLSWNRKSRYGEN